MTGMFRSFRARIFWAILLVAAVAAGLSLWLTREWLEERQLDEARTGLLREARVAGELLLRGENDPEVLARVLDLPDLRLSLLDADGKVLAETGGVSPEGMDNHGDRPEVVQARSEGQGYSLRASGTLHKNFAYAARNLPDGRILRLALPLDSVNLLIQKRLHVALDNAAVRAGRTDKGKIRAGALGKRLGARRDLHIAGDDHGLGQFLCRSGGLRRGGLRGSFLLGGVRGGFACGSKFGRTLARRADDANVRQAGNVVPFLEKDIQKRAFDLGFLVKGGLVGLIGEQNVADLHRVALLLGPLGDDTALNGVSLPGHDHCNCHKNPPNAYCSHISVEFLLNCIHSNSYVLKNQSKRAKFSKP